MTPKAIRSVAQAWIELVAEDPEAFSALDVARQQLAAGRHLKRLRRIRLVELDGRLPARERLESLLHGSTQFYNPHKERCVVRLGADEPPPLADDEQVVLVFERDGTRRAAAERWWQHETGEAVAVREGTAWALAFDPSPEPDAVDDLTLVRGRRHGLLCNPHSQECRMAGERVPLPWIDTEEPAATGTKRPRKRSTPSSRSKR